MKIHYFRNRKAMLKAARALRREGYDVTTGKIKGDALGPTEYFIVQGKRIKKRSWRRLRK
ncbi:MAG: hypothetical protein QXE06_07005 [Candidatus Bathyarchaeia archaeon]